MRNQIFMLCALIGLLSSCRSSSVLNSITTIPPQQSFVLGEGKHGGYDIRLQNTSANDLTVRQVSLDGTVEKTIVAPPDKWVALNVPKDKTLMIDNPATKRVNVKIVVKRATNLSMGYSE
jgi:hypothetical protein